MIYIGPGRIDLRITLYSMADPEGEDGVVHVHINAAILRHAIHRRGWGRDYKAMT